MRWTRVLLLSAALVLFASGASALGQIGFATGSGKFAMASGVLDFGTDLRITFGTNNSDIDDPTVVGLVVQLDALELTGNVTSVGAGLSLAEIDDSIDYMLRIFQPAEADGALLLSASYDPGEFVVIGSSGTISPEISLAVTNIMLMSDMFPALTALTEGPVDLNVVLSAAGQDLASRIQSGNLATGTVAGTFAVIPEPGTIALLGTGLAGLAAARRRRLA